MPSQAQLDRLARLLKTTSQAEIARQMKISRGTVANWKKKVDGDAPAKPGRRGRTARATGTRLVNSKAPVRRGRSARVKTRAAVPAPLSDLDKEAAALRHKAEAILKRTTTEIAQLQRQQAEARQLLEKLSGGRQDLRKRSDRRTRMGVGAEDSVPTTG